MLTPRQSLTAAAPGLAIAALVLVAAVLALAFVPSAQASVPQAPAKGKTVVADVCYEDEPCWTWSTMGNLQRGVVLNTPRGERKRRAILDPCGFAYYDHMGWIDWKRTPRLRGDGFARRNGCNPRLYA